MNEIGTSPPNPNMPRKSYAGGTFTGLVVIIVGLGFLAGNFGIHLPLFAWHNWWALFILVGAAGPASHALRRYRDTGAVDVEVAGSLVSTLVIVIVALMFLLDLSFGRWWPLFVIFGGLYMVVSGWFGRGRRRRGCANQA